MASDDKKTKTSPPSKDESPPKKKGESPPKNKDTSEVSASKAEGGEETADLSSNYSRGEGQKPVSKAYKDNWNAIYANKKNDDLPNEASESSLSAFCSLDDQPEPRLFVS